MVNLARHEKTLPRLRPWHNEGKSCSRGTSGRALVTWSATSPISSSSECRGAKQGRNHSDRRTPVHREVQAIQYQGSEVEATVKSTEAGRHGSPCVKEVLQALVGRALRFAARSAL